MRATCTVEQILGTRSRVRVLRVLHGVNVPLNTSQIAKQARLSHPAASAALDELADAGVVGNSLAGRSRVHWLVRENLYVQEMVNPVFRAEEDMPSRMEANLRVLFESDAISVVLFGSYARGEQNTQSDVDVVLVGVDDAAKDRLEEAFCENSSMFRERYGSSLSVIVYSAREAAALRQRAPELQAALERDGLVVCGAMPSEWRNLGEQQ